jgi:hypothetical protein
MRSYLGIFLAIAGVTPILLAEDAAAPAPSPVNSPVPTGLKPATYFQANVDGPYIAMTFDDGPSPETTPRLLDILKQRNKSLNAYWRKGTKSGIIPGPIPR